MCVTVFNMTYPIQIQNCKVQAVKGVFSPRVDRETRGRGVDRQTDARRARRHGRRDERDER